LQHQLQFFPGVQLQAKLSAVVDHESFAPVF
jgi:hypothetical protein